MRSLFLFLLFITLNLSSQVTIFSENFGNTGGSFIAASTYTGYQHYGEQTYTGTASVRNTLPSTGYAGASGVANVFFTNVAGTSITVSGINTYCYILAFLSVGIWKSTTASNGSEFVIEYSDNGGPWTQMPFTLPTGTGTSIWRNVTLADYLPLTTNLALRFRQTSSAGVQFRIDDINVAGIQNITDSTISNCTGFVYDGTLYTQDSVYIFSELDYKGCDSLVRIEYIYDPNDANCILPVELVDFEGQQIANSIQLSWKTLSESNSESFFIEKLINDNWTSLNRLAAAGYSNAPMIYQYYDQTPTEGTNYYRLNQVDFDGTSTLSDIIAVKFIPDYSLTNIDYYDLLGKKVIDLQPNTIYIEVIDGKAKKILYIQQ